MCMRDAERLCARNAREVRDQSDDDRKVMRVEQVYPGEDAFPRCREGSERLSVQTVALRQVLDVGRAGPTKTRYGGVCGCAMRWWALRCQATKQY